LRWPAAFPRRRKPPPHCQTKPTPAAGRSRPAKGRPGPRKATGQTNVQVSNHIPPPSAVEKRDVKLLLFYHAGKRLSIEKGAAGRLNPTCGALQHREPPWGVEDAAPYG